jgi:NAD(P)-dependent dehydrogenase (short-subunit alcohol dehydrogenase family)
MLDINLKGKTAIVTGVTSGIGLGVAKMLARAGCNVSGCGRSASDSAAAKRYVSEVSQYGASCLYTTMDVTDSKGQKKFLKRTLDIFTQVDILVSNAGINVFEGLQNCSDEQWDFNLELNLKSHWKLSRLCKPFLEKSGNGIIIIMTSNHAFHTMPGCFPYNVTKTAIKGLVQSLAIEWGPSIRSIGLAPGFIDTAGNQKWFDSFDDPKRERERTVKLHPTKRLGQADEIGAFCAFLCSDYARFASGTTYLVDGGRSALMQDDYD